MANRLRAIRERAARWPQIGELRKGDNSGPNGAPRDLDYFRFTSEIPGMEERFREVYGDEPKVLEGCLIPYRLDRALDASRQEWDASGLIHECDGLYLIRKRGPNGRLVDVEPDTELCPYHDSDNPKCKVRGALWVMLPKLGAIGVVKVQSGSQNIELGTWYDTLMILEENLPNGTKGVLVDLRRSPRKLTYVDGSGKRRSTTKSMISLAYNTLWTQHELPKLAPALAPALTGAVPVAPALGDGYEVLSEDDIDWQEVELEDWQKDGLARYGIGWGIIEDSIIKSGGMTRRREASMAKAWQSATATTAAFAEHLLHKVAGVTESGLEEALALTLNNIERLEYVNAVDAFGNLFNHAGEDPESPEAAAAYAVAHLENALASYS